MSENGGRSPDTKHPSVDFTATRFLQTSSQEERQKTWLTSDIFIKLQQSVEEMNLLLFGHKQPENRAWTCRRRQLGSNPPVRQNAQRLPKLTNVSGEIKPSSALDAADRRRSLLLLRVSSAVSQLRSACEHLDTASSPLIAVCFCETSLNLTQMSSVSPRTLTSIVCFNTVLFCHLLL